MCVWEYMWRIFAVEVVLWSLCMGGHVWILGGIHVMAVVDICIIYVWCVCHACSLCVVGSVCLHVCIYA